MPSGSYNQNFHPASAIWNEVMCFCLVESVNVSFNDDDVFFLGVEHQQLQSIESTELFAIWAHKPRRLLRSSSTEAIARFVIGSRRLRLHRTRTLCHLPLEESVWNPKLVAKSKNSSRIISVWCIQFLHLARPLKALFHIIISVIEFWFMFTTSACPIAPSPVSNTHKSSMANKNYYQGGQTRSRWLPSS